MDLQYCYEGKGYTRQIPQDVSGLSRGLCLTQKFESWC